MPALIAEAGDRTAFRGCDQAIGDQPFDHTIEIAGSELHDTVGTVGDFFDQTVTVLITLDEREENEEIDGSERKQAAGVGRHELGTMIFSIIRTLWRRVSEANV